MPEVQASESTIMPKEVHLPGVFSHPLLPLKTLELPVTACMCNFLALHSKERDDGRKRAGPAAFAGASKQRRRKRRRTRRRTRRRRRKRRTYYVGHTWSMGRRGSGSSP